MIIIISLFRYYPTLQAMRLSRLIIKTLRVSIIPLAILYDPLTLTTVEDYT